MNNKPDRGVWADSFFERLGARAATVDELISDVFESAFTEKGGSAVNHDPNQGGDIEVPDFSGKTMRDVADIALRLGLEPVLVGSNLATDQSPAAGAKVRRGAKITVQFGTPLEKKSKTRPGIRN